MTITKLLERFIILHRTDRNLVGTPENKYTIIIVYLAVQAPFAYHKCAHLQQVRYKDAISLLPWHHVT